jgi:mannosyltransferase
MKKEEIQLSIIIPSYNEELIIAETLQKVSSYLKKNKKDFGLTEVIVVSAGQDKTSKIALSKKDLFDKFKLVSPAKIGGKGRDVRLGFKAATGQVQIFMDADLATPLHHIKTAYLSLTSGSDVVIGVRKLSKIHPGFLRSLFSMASNLVTRMTLFPTIRDTQCGFKGFTKSAAKKAFLRQRLNGWGFDIELLQLVRECKLKLTQQQILDWEEGREEGLRGDNLFTAGFKTFADILLVRLEAWGRFMGRHYRPILVMAMASTFALALSLGLKQSVWFDESYSIMLAKSSIPDLFRLTGVDAHPPFYYLLLKGWASIFGYSELALRALSALLASFSVGAMFMFIKKFFRLSAATVTLPLLVLAPFLVRYSFEVRMYSLVTLLVVLATYFLKLGLEQNRKKDWAIYALLITLGMYTLYMSALVWAAHFIYVSYYQFKFNSNSKFNSKQKSGGLINFISQKSTLAYITAGALFLPYLTTLISQFKNSALPSITSAVGFRQLTSILSFGLIYRPETQISPALGLLLMAFLVLMIRLVSSSFSTGNRAYKANLSLVLSVLLLPIALLALVSLLSPYFMERYVAHYIIFGYTLIGITLDSAWRKGRHKEAFILGALSLALLMVGTFNLHQTGNYNYQNDTKPSAKQLLASIPCDQNTTVLAYDPYIYIDLLYTFQKDLHCNFKFYSQEELPEFGAYNALNNSPQRVSSYASLNTQEVYYISPGSKEPLDLSGYDYQNQSNLLKAQDFGGFKLSLYERL